VQIDYIVRLCLVQSITQTEIVQQKIKYTVRTPQINHRRRRWPPTASEDPLVAEHEKKKKANLTRADAFGKML